MRASTNRPTAAPIWKFTAQASAPIPLATIASQDAVVQNVGRVMSQRPKAMATMAAIAN